MITVNRGSDYWNTESNDWFISSHCHEPQVSMLAVRTSPKREVAPAKGRDNTILGLRSQSFLDMKLAFSRVPSKLDITMVYSENPLYVRI